MPKIVFSLGLGLLAGWILFTSGRGLSSSLDWDELDVSSKIVNKEYERRLTPEEEKTYGIRIPDVIDPRKNVRNHFIATISSVGLVQWLGPTKSALRAPALLFTGLLLLSLFLARRLLSPATALITTAHLAVNGLCLWYFHSMRGYASLLFFSTALYLLALKYQERGELSPGERFLFYLLFWSAPLTHVFGAIFCGLLMTTGLGLALIRSRATQSWAPLRREIRFLAPCFPALLWIGYLFVPQLIFISRIGYLRSSQSPGLSEPLLAVFGVRSGKMMALIAALFALTALFTLVKRQAITFRFLFAAFSWVSVIGVLTLLKTSFFEPRFVLCFLLPSLFWILPVLTARRLGTALALFFFIALPWREQAASIAAVQAPMKHFDDFIGQVQAATGAEPCFLITGETDQVYFGRSLYLKGESVHDPSCASRYHVHFGRNWQGEIPLGADPAFDYQELLHDDEGRQLYSLTRHSAIARRD